MGAAITMNNKTLTIHWLPAYKTTVRTDYASRIFKVYCLTEETVEPANMEDKTETKIEIETEADKTRKRKDIRSISDLDTSGVTVSMTSEGGGGGEVK